MCSARVLLRERFSDLGRVISTGPPNGQHKLPWVYSVWALVKCFPVPAYKELYLINLNGLN